MKKKLMILVLLALTQFLVVLDGTIVTVALPAIKESLGFSAATLQWVLTAYILAFGGFMLLGGRAADLYGRRKVLLLGLLGFTTSSLLIGLSQSSEMFIAMRALQGLSAAFMSPAALSLLLTTFNEGHDRDRALSIWTIVATGGSAAGLLLGGILTQVLSWHWIFFINVPIGLLALVGIYKIIPVHVREENDKNLDIPGAILVTTGLMALVFAVSEAPVLGALSVPIVITFIASLILLTAFVINESRVKHPLMPLSIFKVRNVVGGNLVMLPAMAGVMGMFFFISLYIQNYQHFTQIQAGLAFLPFPIVAGVIAWYAPRIIERLGLRRALLVGTTLPLIGILLLTMLPAQANYFIHILPSMILMPLGLGIFFMSAVVAATSGVPGRESGLVSGLINTTQQIGSALGIAILSTVAVVVTSLVSSDMAWLVSYRVAFGVSALLMVGAVAVVLFVIRVPRK